MPFERVLCCLAFTVLPSLKCFGRVPFPFTAHEQKQMIDFGRCDFKLDMIFKKITGAYERICLFSVSNEY